jgi:hypothetical protein
MVLSLPMNGWIYTVVESTITSPNQESFHYSVLMFFTQLVKLYLLKLLQNSPSIKQQSKNGFFFHRECENEKNLLSTKFIFQIYNQNHVQMFAFQFDSQLN